MPEGAVDGVRSNVPTLSLGILVIGERAEPARLDAGSRSKLILRGSANGCKRRD